MAEIAEHRSKSGKGDNRLTLFGRAIERARKQLAGQDRKTLTQENLRDRLRLHLGESISQSYVARIEQGLVRDPSVELLVALSQELNMDESRLVSLINQDKYGTPAPRAFTLETDTISLDQLAMWESSVTSEDLWIVATKFVDNYQDKFQLAIETVLSRPETTVTFFIPRALLESFEYYRTRILSRTGREGTALIAVGLTDDQVAVMAASYVIANPGLRLSEHKDEYRNLRPDGYVIIHNLQGEPEVAIKMSYNDIVQRAMPLNRLRNDALQKYGNSAVIFSLTRAGKQL